MRNNIILIGSFFYILTIPFYIFISGFNVINILDELVLVYLFCMAPAFFFKSKKIEYNKGFSTPNISYYAIILLPIVFLLVDRITAGFGIDINPVLMRDQMLERHREGLSGGFLSVFGNLLTLPAYILIIDYWLFGERNHLKTILGISFFCFMIWIAGSRAFILVIIGTAWMLSGFPKLSLKYLPALAILFLFMSMFFFLRAYRSEIPIDWYTINTLDHLGISYDIKSIKDLSPVSSVFVISLAYVFHTLDVVSKIIDMSETTGISIGPVSHMYGKVFGYDNSQFEFPGLFLTEFGNILYDFGWLGIVIFFSCKVFLIFWLSRSKSTIKIFFAYCLMLNCVFGIFSPLYNLIFFYPILFSCFFIFYFRSKWITSRSL